MVCYEQGIQKILINSSCESSISMRHLPKTSGYRLSSPSVYIFTVMLVSRADHSGATHSQAPILMKIVLREGTFTKGFKRSFEV